MNRRDDVQRVRIERTTGRKVWEFIIFKIGGALLVLAALVALIKAVA